MKFPPHLCWSPARRKAALDSHELRCTNAGSSAWRSSHKLSRCLITINLRKGVCNSLLPFALLHWVRLPDHWNMVWSKKLSTWGFQIFACRWRNPAPECYLWKYITITLFFNWCKVHVLFCTKKVQGQEKVPKPAEACTQAPKIQLWVVPVDELKAEDAPSWLLWNTFTVVKRTVPLVRHARSLSVHSHLHSGVEN